MFLPWGIYCGINAVLALRCVSQVLSLRMLLLLEVCGSVSAGGVQVLTAVVFDIISQTRLVLTFPALCSKAGSCCSCCLSSLRSLLDQRETVTQR